MPQSGRIRASSIGRALLVIGDRWTQVILAHAFLGARRFGEWRSRTGIAGNILSNRLKRLVANDCMHKTSGSAGQRHSEYLLTEKGLDLYPIALMEWWFEQRWSSSRQADTLTHTSCGLRMHPRLVCGHCRSEVKAHAVSYREGPGAGHDPQLPPRHSRRPSGPAPKGAGAHGLFGVSGELLGDRWTRLVVVSPFLGLRRFDQMQRAWRFATNILTDRLKRLLDSGVLQRRLYQTGPDRYEYVLTPKGLDLYPVVLTMLRWGDRWLSPKSGPPILLRHKPCGHRLVPTVVCDQCGEELRADMVNIFPAAGARRSAETDNSRPGNTQHFPARIGR